MFHSLKDSRVLAEKDYYCAGYKMYFEHALRRVHEDLVKTVRLFPPRGPASVVT